MIEQEVNTGMAAVLATVAMPFGLRQLLPLSIVLVKQKRSSSGFLFRSFNNEYAVTTINGAPIFIATENTTSAINAALRNFTMTIVDTQHREVMQMSRTVNKCSCYFPNRMNIWVCGELVTIVRQKETYWTLVLNVNDCHDNPVVRVKNIRKNMYELQNIDKQGIGMIERISTGALLDIFNTLDNFHVSFPRDLDVRYKAALIGVAVLIDYMKYE